jgi:hypothetical protein
LGKRVWHRRNDGGEEGSEDDGETHCEDVKRCGDVDGIGAIVEKDPLIPTHQIHVTLTAAIPFGSHNAPNDSKQAIWVSDPLRPWHNQALPKPLKYFPRRRLYTLRHGMTQLPSLACGVNKSGGYVQYSGSADETTWLRLDSGVGWGCEMFLKDQDVCIAAPSNLAAWLA